MATYFNREWLKIEQCKDWLVEDHNSKFAKCRVCSHPKHPKHLLCQIWEKELWWVIWKERSTFNACKIAPNQNRTVSFSLISRLAKSKVRLMLQCNHQVRRWIILCMMIRVWRMRKSSGHWKMCKLIFCWNLVKACRKCFRKCFQIVWLQKTSLLVKTNVHITSIMVSDLAINWYLPMRSKHPHIIQHLLTKR